MHQRLFLALEFIYDTMKDAKLNEEFIFIHYDRSDHLYYDQDGSLMKKYIEDKCKLVIRYIPDVPSDLTPKEHTISQLKAIIKSVGYFRNEPLPSFVRNHDIELTFIEPSLAVVFCKKVKDFWMQKKNIPVGLECLFIQPEVFEPENFKGKRVRIACRSSNSNPSAGAGRRQFSGNRLGNQNK